MSIEYEFKSSKPVTNESIKMTNFSKLDPNTF